MKSILRFVCKVSWHLTGGRGGNGGGIIGLYARGIALIHGYVSVAGENGQGDVGLSTGYVKS